MALSGFVHIVIMLIMFLGLVVAIAWVFQGMTEGEEKRAATPRRVRPSRSIHKPGARVLHHR